jgi:hypothetical protein
MMSKPTLEETIKWALSEKCSRCVRHVFLAKDMSRHKPSADYDNAFDAHGFEPVLSSFL